MHTFFINTSKKSLAEYDVLFDVQRESRQFISLECPLHDWDRGGYAGCVKKIGDMIDGYAEINNDFLLIIYIDLNGIGEYASAPRGEMSDRERDERGGAMRRLFTHMVAKTVVGRLADSGRRPAGTLIMFGEEKIFSDQPAAPRREGEQEKFLRYIGIPDYDAVAAAVNDAEKSDSPEAAFEKKIDELRAIGAMPEICGLYSDEIRTWCREIMSGKKISDANYELFEAADAVFKSEQGRKGIKLVSCRYDSYAARVNKSVLAMSGLNIALHLLKCLYAGSVCQQHGDEPLPFRQYTADEVAPWLKSKEKIYSDTEARIASPDVAHGVWGSVPHPLAFDAGKFGLDKYGYPAEDDPEKSKEPEMLLPGAVTIEDRTADGSRVNRKTTPEEYIGEAKKVCDHHRDYLKKLKNSISDVLSDYAGRSQDGKPAQLRMGSAKYATSAGAGETRPIETETDISEQSYATKIEEYMKFCAGRSVKLTDIEDVYDWFVTRVRQIDESMKKVKRIATGLFAAVIMLYLPFPVIQYEAITKNVLTLATAIGSVVVPVVLLYAALGIAVAVQRKKCAEAWRRFMERSDEALKENTDAVNAYNRLLCFHIPALRWVYEYKLDVSFSAECFRIADAKIEHHRRKLCDRVRAIGNLLGDLECGGAAPDPAASKEDVPECNYPFCVGEKNRRFYDVIGTDFFGKTTEEGVDLNEAF